MSLINPLGFGFSFIYPFFFFTQTKEKEVLNTQIFYSFAASLIVTSLITVSTLCLYFERPVEEDDSVLEIDTREEYKNPLLSTIVPIMTQLYRLLCDPFYFFVAISGGMMFGSIASFAISLNTFVKIFGYSQVFL